MQDCVLPSLRSLKDNTLFYYRVHALVISRLDYGNAVLYGITEALTTKLQMVQNSAARLISRQRKHQHITPVLNKLHWLPVCWRVKHTLLVLVFSALHELAPKYIQDLVTPYSPNRNLRLLISVCSWFRATIWRATAGGLSRCLGQHFGTVCLKTFASQTLRNCSV